MQVFSLGVSRSRIFIKKDCLFIMAEARPITENIVCRFFLSGLCRDAENCIFSHDRSREVPDSVCRYYLQRKCIFGLNCRYDHILINEVTSGTNSRNKRMPTDPSTCSYSSNSLTPMNWIDAPTFVPPHNTSYADTVKANTDVNNQSMRRDENICPLFAEANGNVCDLCGQACLDPFNEEARKSHIEKCEKEIEEEMEFSFAVQASLNKTCGICMDVVLEKEPVSERRFGILENCNHVYCLNCIRKWRQSGQFENNQMTDSIVDKENIRACPECRIVSNFVIPSNYFVDESKTKQLLVAGYKTALSKKHCKYFKQGEGVCAFGGSCFYLHAKPDGTKVDLPPSTRRRRENKDGQRDYMELIHLWDYIEHREGNAVPWITDNDSSDDSD